MFRSYKISISHGSLPEQIFYDAAILLGLAVDATRQSAVLGKGLTRATNQTYILYAAIAKTGDELPFPRL